MLDSFTIKLKKDVASKHHFCQAQLHLILFVVNSDTMHFISLFQRDSMGFVSLVTSDSMDFPSLVMGDSKGRQCYFCCGFTQKLIFNHPITVCYYSALSHFPLGRWLQEEKFVMKYRCFRLRDRWDDCLPSPWKESIGFRRKGINTLVEIRGKTA